MDISKAKNILEYWFSKGLYTPDYDKWFMKSQDYDEEIKEKFGDLLKEAERGKGLNWLSSKDSFVAYIILMDQFSRHIYRNTSNAFKNDEWALIFTEMGFDIYREKLVGYEFMFAFMPYMHTEILKYQKKGKTFFYTQKNLYGTEHFHKRKLTNPIDTSYMTSIEPTKNDKEYTMLKSMEPHVTGHLRTIEVFGRFPKRNKALGRESTTHEISYMENEEVKKRPY